MARLAFIASLLFVVACTSAPAGASPSPVASVAIQPTPTAQATVSPTVAATPSPAIAGSPSSGPVDCYMDYGDCDKYTPRPTPADATSQPTPALEMIIDLSDDGAYLVDMDGLSLYTFDADPPGEATCLAGCADSWPPLGVLAPFQVAVAGAGVLGTLGLFERDDVALTQVTYNDRPLYYYVGDEHPGETNGDGLGGVWHLAAP